MYQASSDSINITPPGRGHTKEGDTMNTARSIDYEKNFKAYLFRGDLERFKNICKNVGIMDNMKCLNDKEQESKRVKN